MLVYILTRPLIISQSVMTSLCGIPIPVSIYKHLYLYLYIYVCLYMYNWCTYVYVHICISAYIRRPLPELERARLQLQPSITILQTAALPSCRLHPTAASRRMHPTLYQLKAAALICHRPPQGAKGCRTPSPPHPQETIKSVPPFAQEY